MVDGTRPRRRRLWWLVTLVALVASSGAVFWLGSRSQSPEQAAARAAAPEASWVTEAVDLRVLSSTLIQRGDVRPEVSTSVGVPVSVEGAGVVTKVTVGVGDELAEGALGVEVSGRPVFVMQGDVPVFRSLKPGMSGEDVTQLQRALARLGFATDTDGVYGESTEAAVAAFYAAAGYDPVPATATAALDVADARRTLESAESAVTVAEAALVAAGAETSGSAVAGARVQVTAARRSLDAAKAARGTDGAAAQAAVATAARVLGEAVAAQSGEVRIADLAVAAATQAVTDAVAKQVEDVGIAELQLAGARANHAAVVAAPDSTQAAIDQARLEVVQAEAALADVRRVSAGAVSAANATLEQSRIALEATKRSTQTAVDEAGQALTAAEAGVGTTAVAAQAAIDTAAEALLVATLALDEAAGSTAGTAAILAVDDAVKARDAAATALAEVVLLSGPTVAQGEVVFVPAFPARVQSAVTVVGDLGDVGSADGSGGGGGSLGDSGTGSGGLLSLSAGRLVVASTVRQSDAGLVRTEMAVELLDELSGVVYPATIASVAEDAVVGADGQTGFPMVIVSDEELPLSMSGSNVRVTLTAAATDGEVLVVPVAAVSSAADGSTRVSVLDSGAVDPRDVAVVAGLSADGFVAIEAVVQGSLAAGDRVVVGR